MNAPIGGKVTPPALADFIVLNEEIAALVRARIPLEAQLAQLGAELPGKAGGLAERIGRRLEAGESLTAAMDAECASLPPTYRAAVLAGAQSGELASALESLVDSASRLDQLRRVTGLALLYPLVIVLMACALLAFVIVQVVPSFEWLDQHRLRSIAWLAHSPLTVPVLAIGVPCLAILSAAIWWWRSGRLGGVRATRFGLLTWLPGARRVHRLSQAATFAEMLQLLVDRGLPFERALDLAAEATDDARLHTAAKRLAGQIRQGSAADAAATTASELPLLIRLAFHHTGDRTLLTGSLRQAAAMYHERAIRAAEWYAEYLPILLTVVIGGTLTIGFTLFVIWPYAAMLHDLAEWNWR